jgi:hypothetical protein
MDALALLCNLHADGPFTLQRLRRSGCDSLTVLLELAPVQLATHLDGSERTAQRFLREANLLTERLEDEDPWEQEHAEEIEVDEPLLHGGEVEEEAELDETHGYDEEEEAEAEEEEAEEEEEEEEEILDEAAEGEIAHVLDAWRQVDDDAPPEDPVDYVVPRAAPPSAANKALDELHLDGLDGALRERLGQVGILSLKGLVEASPLELARSLPLAFTRVKHIQFLAARVWQERSEPLQAPRSYDELVAVERLDASGPFASEPGHSPT